MTFRDREGESQVTTLELFFDLVLVLAITQVTSLIARSDSWTGLAQGVGVLTALWWAWAGYTWVGNTVNPEEGAVRIVMFAAMAALLVTALAVPGAFSTSASTFAVGYLAVRILHIVVYSLPARGDAGLHRVLARFSITGLAAPLMLVVASFLDGPGRATVWITALVLDFAGPLWAGAEGWRLESPGHFVERHGLIVIIALGESIVAIGVGASGLVLGAGVLGAAIVGMAVVCSLWWFYFDVLVLVAERRVREAEGVDRIRRARDVFSYLHLPLVAGIILFAVGLKAAIAHPGDALHTIPAVCLAAGVGLYLWGLSVIRLRGLGRLNQERSVAGTIAAGLVGVVLHVPALVALGLLAALTWATIGYEVRKFGSVRHRVRNLGEGGPAMIPVAAVADPAVTDAG